MEIMKITNNIFEILTTENAILYREEIQKNYNNYVTNPVINTIGIEEQNTVDFQSNIKKA